MKKNRIIILIVAFSIIILSLNFSALCLNAASTVAAPLSSNWITSGKYQFQLTSDGVLNCKIRKKTTKLSEGVLSAFIYGTNVLYKTTSSIQLYEAKRGSSYTINLKYAEGVSSTIPISDVMIAGLGRDVIYYSIPVNSGQRLLFSYNYQNSTVDYIANYGYISKVYCVDKYVYVLTNTSSTSNTTGYLCRIDVATNKEKILSYNAISASFDSKKVYWAEPAADYTYTLGIGSLKIKSCRISDTKIKTITTLDDIDTYKTVVCLPKFVTCTSKSDITFKYTYKNKKKTAYESYQQKELMAQANVLY